MNFIRMPLLLLLTQSLVSCTSNRGSEKPKSWEKDFTIIVSEAGGMKDEATTITFTYDSCNYVKREGILKTTNSYKLNDSDRSEILKKLEEFKADKIRSITTPVINDKESIHICFYDKKEHCISDGATSEIHKDDIENFFKVYSYLSDFAKQKNNIN